MRDIRYPKLFGKIKEVFRTNGAFADAMDMHPCSLSAKLRGRTEWTRAEIVKACELLGISLKDAWKYFFE